MKRVLFITRAYPPVVGGMEKLSYEVTTGVSKLTESYIIANKKGKKNLPFFVPYAFFKSLYLIPKKKIDVIHISDPVLSPVGYFLKKIYNKKVAVTIHGLDVTLDNRIYQAIIPLFLKKLDRYICISSYTKELTINAGLNEDKCVVIPVGVNPDDFILKEKNVREKLGKEINVNLKDKKILLSVGHLVERKGVKWFIENVMPKLNKKFIYLVIGGYGNLSKGDELEIYKKLADEKGLGERVFLLGKVSDRVLKLAYNSADVFVMPNIPVKGDVEGFGMVAIEASSCGVPVVASNIEGIKDAVKDGKNGYLVESGDSNSFVKKIKNLKKLKVREFTRENYSWGEISKTYLESF